MISARRHDRDSSGPHASATRGFVHVDEIAIRNAAIPALEVSGTPPTGMDGDALTNIVVDEASRMITADVPANSSQGYLTITPAQVIQSVTLEGGKLVVRW